MYNKQELNQMINFCKKNEFDVEGKMIDTQILVREERVKMNCFYCGKYNSSWRCPPKIPDIDIEKLFSEFDNAALIYLIKKIDKDNYDIIRNESSIELHKALLLCEKWLWDNNNSTSLSFIGGSCKLCKNGCAPTKCANPYKSRSPVESLGINIVKSATTAGINIEFPPKDKMVRIGLLLW